MKWNKPRVFLNKRCPSHKGFSMMEMILALGILGVVGGTMIPLAMNQIDSSKKAAAEKDVKTFMGAITSFMTDVQESPNRLNGTTPNSFNFIFSAGNAANTPPTYYAAASGSSLNSHLLQNSVGYSAWNTAIGYGWRGPYLSSDKSDPWGGMYYLSMRPWRNNDLTQPAWIISPGKNFTLETTDTSTSIPANSDDVGIRIN